MVSWIENERRRASGSKILPPLPIFEFDKKIPIQEILADSRLGSTRAKGRSLYARLVELPPEEHQQEIDELESALREQARRRSGTLLDLDKAETIVSGASVLWDFTCLPFGGLKRLGGQLIEELRRAHKIDQMMMQLENTLNCVGRNQDLDFLSRISRVASFRRERV